MWISSFRLPDLSGPSLEANLTYRTDGSNGTTRRWLHCRVRMMLQNLRYASTYSRYCVGAGFTLETHAWRVRSRWDFNCFLDSSLQPPWATNRNFRHGENGSKKSPGTESSPVETRGLLGF